MDVPLVTREQIRAHDKVTGPAIIVEPTGTNVVEPGWQAPGDWPAVVSFCAASSRFSAGRPSAPAPTR